MFSDIFNNVDIGEAYRAIVPSTITWNYTEHAKLCGRSSYIPKSECEGVCLEYDMSYEIQIYS